MTKFEMIKRHFKTAGVIQIFLGLMYGILTVFFSFVLDNPLLSVSGLLVFLAVFVVTGLCLLYLLHLSVKKNPFNHLPRAERKKIIRNYQFAKWTVVPFLVLIPIMVFIGIKLGFTLLVSMFGAMTVFMIPVGLFTFAYADKMAPRPS